MKYVRQFGIIMAVSFVGELLNYFIPLPVPGSIYGLVLMFLLLYTKAVKLDDVKDTAGFLMEIMPLMFILPAVSLLNYLDVIRSNAAFIIVGSVISTVIVMAVTGRVVQAVMKRKRGRAEQEDGE